jgi:quinohemoprotein ethanol dehydrogenase
MRGINDGNDDVPLNAGSSALLAWNPVLKKAAWTAPTAGQVNGGTIATAGNLVFQGQADGQFVAYAADSGKVLWSFKTDNAVIAPPISFSAGGKQYVSVLSGMSGSASAGGSPQAQFGFQAREHTKRLLTFVLDGKAETSAIAPAARAIPVDDPEFKVDAEMAAKGSVVYATKTCTWCHGLGAVASGGAPDLRASQIVLSPPTFEQVVRGGILQANGMPTIRNHRFRAGGPPALSGCVLAAGRGQDADRDHRRAQIGTTIRRVDSNWLRYG